MDPSQNHWFSQNGKHCLQRKSKNETMTWQVKKKMDYTLLTVIKISAPEQLPWDSSSYIHSRGRELTGVPRVLAAPLAHLSSSLQPKPAGRRQSKAKNCAGSFSWAPGALRATSGCLWDGVGAARAGWVHLNCKVLELTWLNGNADTHTAFAEKHKKVNRVLVYMMYTCTYFIYLFFLENIAAVYAH